MTKDQPTFDDLLAEAHRALLALDNVTKRDSAKATAAAVSDGQNIFSKLLDYQRFACLSRAEASALLKSLDMLRARLLFLGERVQSTR
jgi:hypothetical protein